MVTFFNLSMTLFPFLQTADSWFQPPMLVMMIMWAHICNLIRIAPQYFRLISSDIKMIPKLIYEIAFSKAEK